MLHAALSCAFALLTGVLVTPLVRKHAHRVGAVDHALSSRKLHTRPTPRLGGVAIVAAFFVPFLVFLCAGRMSQVAGKSATIVGFFAGAAAIAALGVYDDLRGASPKLKFLVQFGVAGLAYAAGFRILSIATPFGALDLGWLALPFTVVFVVGVINAINLIDGLDGLAGGVAVLAGVTFFVAAALRGDALTMWVTAALIGGTLGFLVYNFNPASIFMGDTGSMFLGFVLALTAIRSHANADGSVAMAAPVLALLVPIGDTLLSMARRALRGVPVFRGDKEHIHHKLLASGLSHRGAVLVVYAATAVLGGAALVVGSLGGMWAAVGVTVTVAVAVGVALRRLGYFDAARLNDTLVVRQRNLRVRREMAQVAVQLRGANKVDDVWTAVERAATVLDARWAAVKLVVDVDGKRRGLTVAGTEEAPPSGHTRSRHGLLAERPEKGFLELAWPGEQTPCRDSEIAIETLCVQVREALEGVVERPSMVVALRPQLYSLPPVSVGGRWQRPSIIPVIPSDRKAA